MLTGQEQVLKDGKERLDSFYESAQSLDTKGKYHLFSIAGPVDRGYPSYASHPAIIWCGVSDDPEELETMTKKWRRRLKGRPIYRVPQSRFIKFPYDPNNLTDDDVYPYLLDSFLEYEKTGQELVDRKNEDFAQKQEMKIEYIEEKEEETKKESSHVKIDDDGVVHLNFIAEESDPSKVPKRKTPTRTYTKPQEEDVQDIVQNPFCVMSICYKYETYDAEREPAFVIRFEGSGRDNIGAMQEHVHNRYKQMMNVLVCQYGTWVELMSNARNVQKRTLGLEALQTAHDMYMNPNKLGVVKPH